MRLLAIGLNHTTAPVSIREQFAVDKDTALKGLMQIGSYGANEAVLLITCNRCELYAVVNDLNEDSSHLRQFMLDMAGADADAAEYFYSFADEECIRHLFLVSSSLDSLIIGEGQILSQVKAAYAMAREAGSVSTVLNTLFHRAIAVGKRVRTETRIAYNSVSVSYAAVELAKRELHGLDNKRALIFGAGKMAELTAKHLLSNNIDKIYVANRHIEKGRELAKTVHGEAVPLDDALTLAESIDIIVTSTGAPHYVIKAWETRRLMAKRKGRPLFLIDIAVPRDVDPDVGKIKGITLYNIDDLHTVVDAHIDERNKEANVARAIVEEEVVSITAKFQYLSFRPLMALLSERAERIRQRELRRVSGKLLNLTEDEWRQVNNMTKMIVRKLLRTPMMRMNAAAGTKDENFFALAMSTLFKLDTLSNSDDNDTNQRFCYAHK